MISRHFERLQIMNQKTISESDYNRIIQEACEKPFGDVISIGAPPASEKDYLYSVWRGLAKHIDWEMPMLMPANGRTEIELLRDDIHKLVADHQSTNYPIQPTLYAHVNAAIEKTLAP
jgi:hypothetical protein